MVGSDEAELKISESSVNHDFSTPEKQEARTFLRERFLRVISGVIGKEASFQLYENTKVKAEFRGCDIDCLEIFTRNLETPSGKVPEAILRATDVISFEIDNIQQT
ncbi:gem-associated protein 7-like [Athalia rosae]|uniref:gem-associated protein 7-like n=1 Tax=Athalia rosae TaxID=37344 RepID=UPI002033EA43|nr:gem-associated protein 7-like [Athalia rosae]